LGGNGFRKKGMHQKISAGLKVGLIVLTGDQIKGFGFWLKPEA